MKQDIVKEWYEDNKNVGEMTLWDKGRLKIWEEKVTGFFHPGSSVLDVGCGLGREAFALYKKGFAVTGIDITEPIIEKVKQLAQVNNYTIPFLLYNGRDLPFEDGSFDVVVIWAQTFGLLYGDEYKNSFLKECSRVLKENGILSYSGHDYQFETEHYKQCLKGRKFYPYADSEIYWETFTPEELKSFAENAGFEVLECSYGEIYKPEDGIVLQCICRKNR